MFKQSPVSQKMLLSHNCRRKGFVKGKDRHHTTRRSFAEPVSDEEQEGVHFSLSSSQARVFITVCYKSEHTKCLTSASEERAHERASES